MLNPYVTEQQVTHYEEEMQQKLRHKALLKAVANEREPVAVRIGEWLIRIGTELKESYEIAADTPPALETDLACN